MARVLVLCVDVSVLAPTLLGAGHEFVCTRDADSAGRLLGELRPHIVLAELALGGLNFCQRARGSGNKAYITLMLEPVLPLDLRALTDAGADDWLARPFSPRTLLERIEVGMQVVSRRVGAL